MTITMGSRCAGPTSEGLTCGRARRGEEECCCAGGGSRLRAVPVGRLVAAPRGPTSAAAAPWPSDMATANGGPSQERGLWMRFVEEDNDMYVEKFS